MSTDHLISFHKFSIFKKRRSKGQRAEIIQPKKTCGHGNNEAGQASQIITPTRKAVQPSKQNNGQDNAQRIIRDRTSKLENAYVEKIRKTMHLEET